MIRLRFGVACLAALLCFADAITASATLVLYEPFNYPTTAAVPSSGVSGVVGNNIAQNASGAGGYVNPSNSQRWVPRAYSPLNTPYVVADDAHVVAADLTVPGLEKLGTSNAASYGAQGYSALLPLGQAFTPSQAGTSVYYSLAFRINDMSNLAAAGGMVAGLSNVIPTGSNGNPSVAAAGLFVRPDPSNPTTHFQIGLGKTAAGVPGTFIGSYALGTTQFVVGRYTLFDNNGIPETVLGTNDAASMWVNPSSSTFGGAAPAVDLQNGPGGQNDPPVANNQIQSFFLRQTGAATGTNVANVIITDEVRVGTTYASVTPVQIPEPTSVALAVIACAAAVARRRKA